MTGTAESYAQLGGYGPQENVVLNELLSGKNLHQLMATNELGVMRLAAVIHKLRDDGHIIRMDRVHVQNRHGTMSKVGVYRLVSLAPGFVPPAQYAHLWPHAVNHRQTGE